MMTLEEIKKWSNVEIEVELAVLLGIEIDDFCSDLNATAKVEKIVIEKVGSVYGNSLEAVINPFAPETEPSAKLRGNWITHIATASARQRGEASLLTLQNIEVKQ